MSGDLLEFIWDHVLIRVEQRADGETGYVHVRVTADHDEVWSSREPRWRGIRIGVGSGRAYLWSARRIVVIATPPRSPASTVEFDEDIVAPFALGDRWVVACETSVRLLSEVAEVDRLELSEAVTDAWWGDDIMVVRDASGALIRIMVSDRTLTT